MSSSESWHCRISAQLRTLKGSIYWRTNLTGGGEDRHEPQMSVIVAGDLSCEYPRSQRRRVAVIKANKLERENSVSHSRLFCAGLIYAHAVYCARYCCCSGIPLFGVGIKRFPSCYYLHSLIHRETCPFHEG